jgi:hypothetical protein
MHALRSVPSTRAPAWRKGRSPVKAARFDRDYWLSHCEGYRVEASDGRLGFVEEIRRPRDSGRAGDARRPRRPSRAAAASRPGG